MDRGGVMESKRKEKNDWGAISDNNLCVCIYADRKT